MTNMLASALALARMGFRVFPLTANGKEAVLKDWPTLATTNEQQIKRWWANDAQNNIGIETTRGLVIDVDPRKGGDVSFDILTMTEDVPETATSRTWSGGRHLIFQLPNNVFVRGGNDRLGPGLDVKSYHGYIVGPGSIIEGKPYEWLNDVPIVTAPEWLIAACKKTNSKSKAAGERVVEPDETALQLAEAYMLRAPEAFEGDRDNTAFKVAAQLFDYGVSRTTAHELLTDWNYEKCNPPLDPSDIERLVDSAGKNRDRAIGSAHPDAPGFEAVEVAPRFSTQPAENQPVSGKRLYYLTLEEGAQRAFTHGAEPLVDGLIDCAAMSVVYGESNSGKSFTEMDKDYHIAAGRPWAKRDVKQGPVVWVAAEGGAGVFKRLAALKQHYGQGDVPFFVVPCPVDLRRADADVKPLIALLGEVAERAGAPVVKITLDTLSRVIAGGDENSPVDLGMLVKHFDAIRAATGAHLAVIHHCGKDKARGARGHSLLRAATDTEIEVECTDEIQRIGTMTVTKQRDLDSGGKALGYRLHPIQLGLNNRDRVVASCWVEIHELRLPPLVELFNELHRRVMATGNPEHVFGWKYISECAKAFAQSPLPRRETYRQMGQLVQRGLLKKVKDGQYVISKSARVQNSAAQNGV